MYFSLKEHCSDFILWILCLDDETECLLEKMNLPEIKLIKMSEFEDGRLLAIKPFRNPTEYAWTCTANLCRFMLEQKRVEHITYLDADLYFFNRPEQIFTEIGDNSIAIIEHRFPTKQEEYEKKVGRFNVGFVYFKNDPNGRQAVNWWADKVLAWCFDRLENGLYGDQLYLNDWPERFDKVKIIKHPGAGLAPWNIRAPITQERIFYHFHAFKILGKNNFIEAKGYFIPTTPKGLFYQPYIKAIKQTIDYVARFDPNFNYGFSQITFREKIRCLIYNNFITNLLLKNR